MNDQAERGQVLRLSEEEARRRFPGLTVASLGAIKKEKPGGEVTARILFDGTHGIDVNTRIRIRDQERAPIAADVKRVLREKAGLEEPTFALTADISEAHRQVPIDARDWHYLGCQVTPESDVYVHTVGTFGVASASYFWSRVATAVGRLSQYLAGHEAHTWHLLVADDYHLDAGGRAYRAALVVFFVLCAVAGVPLSWHKTAGGDTVSWIGFELLHRSHRLGISERRAAWFVRWTKEVADSEHVHMTKFEEGLGRIMNVAGALDYERPFLGPLYRFLALHPRNTTRHVPSHVAFILRYLSAQISKTRHCECAREMRSTMLAPRVDAQASDTRTGIGGWEPKLDKRGVPDKSRSRWFSLQITKERWPWVYSKGDKPALIVATLEALAVLIALKAFHGNTPGESGTKVQVMPTWTDNRGNGAALNKLMSTRYPLNALLMEMSAYFKHMRIKALIEWTPRTANREADSLANGDTRGFDPELEVKIDDTVLTWLVLPDVLEMGKAADDFFQRKGQLPNRGTKQKKKRRPEERLRMADPW